MVLYADGCVNHTGLRLPFMFPHGGTRAWLRKACTIPLATKYQIHVHNHKKICTYSHVHKQTFPPHRTSHTDICFPLGGVDRFKVDLSYNGKRSNMKTAQNTSANLENTCILFSAAPNTQLWQVAQRFRFWTSSLLWQEPDTIKSWMGLVFRFFVVLECY